MIRKASFLFILNANITTGGIIIIVATQSINVGRNGNQRGSMCAFTSVTRLGDEVDTANNRCDQSNPLCIRPGRVASNCSAWLYSEAVRPWPREELQLL